MAVIQHSNQRVGLFIDTQNLYHSARNLYRNKVDFQKVFDEAKANRIIIRSIAYVITTESGDESMFFDALVKMGVETKSKELQIFPGGGRKADWDIGMVIDAIKLAPKIDVVVLVTGDGDFVPAVYYLKHLGCQVEIMAFGKTCSSRLREAADKFTDLSNDTKKFLL